MSNAQITVVGNLTQDPHLRYTNAGKAVVTLNLATNRSRLNKQTNQWEKLNTTFYRVTFWEAQAENITNSLAKGMEVIVHGELEARDWQSTDGKTGTSLEVRGTAIGPTCRRQTMQVQKVQTQAQSQGYNQPADNTPVFDDGPTPF